jgi:hypothetical protein
MNKAPPVAKTLSEFHRKGQRGHRGELKIQDSRLKIRTRDSRLEIRTRDSRLEIQESEI